MIFANNFSSYAFFTRLCCGLERICENFSQAPAGKRCFGIFAGAIWSPELRKKSCHMRCRSDHRPSSELVTTNWPAVRRGRLVGFPTNLWMWKLSQVWLSENFSFFWKKVCEFSHNYGKSKNFLKKFDFSLDFCGGVWYNKNGLVR